MKFESAYRMVLNSVVFFNAPEVIIFNSLKSKCYDLVLDCNILTHFKYVVRMLVAWKSLPLGLGNNYQVYPISTNNLQISQTSVTVFILCVLKRH